MEVFGYPIDKLSLWIIPLVSSACIAYFFGILFVEVGRTHSNRRSFARNFVLLAMIITAIIMIIKQSIALSLGLVGALSIVRFRVAIKEPEELTYLFLMIAIGIGLGAGEVLFTLIFSTIAALIILIRHYFGSKRTNAGVYNINIISKKAKSSGPVALTEMLTNSASQVSLRRFDESPEEIDALYFAEFKSEEQFNNWRDALVQFDEDVRISFLDPETVF